MDIQPQQPISDDQELAKVLAGITAGADQTAAPADLASGLEQEAATVSASSATAPATDDTADTADDTAADASATPPVPPLPSVPAADTTADGDSALESIKNDALSELRPLVDKLNVSPEEKFDTYLLLIRSTDDAALIAPAHEAARTIADEARRAQALLDIIKEIDYLSGPKQQAA